MFPNPIDTLPLPRHPNLEQYRKLAKELVKACKSADPSAIRDWTKALGHYPKEIEDFARRVLTREERKCALTGAQFVLARIHGFESWPRFAKHVELLSGKGSTFETAAQAVVDGDIATLERLLRTEPALARARSAREHRATLLHYVGANGLENYRQRTPSNAVAIAEALLKAGSEVDAEANMSGGGATPIGMVATSSHPWKAGVQNPLIDLLVAYGARLRGERGAGNNHTLINGCLANGRREASEHLARIGATLDLEGAAGVGRLDIVRSYFNEDGTLKANATRKQMADGFSWACEYGRTDVVNYLLANGMDVNAPLRPHDQTGLHWAAFCGHVESLEALLHKGASVAQRDATFRSAPLGWALHAWAEEPVAPPDRYYRVAALLVAAGAVVEPPQWFERPKLRADPRMRAALTGQASADTK
ncbi:MAG: ankyrin repeat domain-containing protein [Vicinamibacterales bacterium]